MVKEAKHPCPHCLTKFSKKSNRDAHARAVHEKWRDYKCPHCSSLFAGKGDMVRHCRAAAAASAGRATRRKKG